MMDTDVKFYKKYALKRKSGRRNVEPFPKSTESIDRSEEGNEKEFYTNQLKTALQTARKIHKLRRQLAHDIEGLLEAARRMDRDSDAAVLDWVLSVTLLMRTKLLRNDINTIYTNLN